MPVQAPFGAAARSGALGREWAGVKPAATTRNRLWFDPLGAVLGIFQRPDRAARAGL